MELIKKFNNIMESKTIPKYFKKWKRIHTNKKYTEEEAIETIKLSLRTYHYHSFLHTTQNDSSDTEILKLPDFYFGKDKIGKIVFYSLINVVSDTLIRLCYLECKSGDNKIKWNDSFIKDDYIYIYSNTATQTTTLFCGSKEGKKLLFDDEFLEQIKLYFTSLKEPCVLGSKLKSWKGNVMKFSGYPRLNLDSGGVPDELKEQCLIETKRLLLDFFNYKDKNMCNFMEHSSINLTALSLFSGAGGDTLGMETAGVSVVGFVELDNTFLTTHEHNFPGSKLLGQDITKIPDSVFKEYENKVNIVFAGFPCQSFSHAGKKDVNDSRGTLFHQFVRVAKIVKPKWVVGENVKGILTMKTSEGDSVTEAIINEFQKVGYTMIEPFVLKCEEFGVPQKRERCFFVGCLGSENKFDPESLIKVNVFSIENIIEDTLENAIEISYDTDYGISYFKELSDNITVTGKPATNLIKCLSGGELSFGKRSKPTYSEILDIRKPTKTIICSYARMPRMFVPLRSPNGKMYLRQLTINELKQIQGFSKEFILCGNDIQQINQIGNAVPPPVVRAIVEQIKMLSN